MYTFLKNEKGATPALQSFFKDLLEQKRVDGIFVAAGTPYGNLPMPCLISNPEMLDQAEPLAPVAPFNAARQASTLLRSETEKKLALVLKPCELRALVELVKLKQADVSSALLIGLECPGRMESSLFLEQKEKNPEGFCDFDLLGKGENSLCTACEACEQFIPEACDLVISVFGQTLKEGVGIFAKSAAGENLIQSLSCPLEEEPQTHGEDIAKTLEARKAARTALVERTSEKINSLEKFQEVIANCLNCYNCRVACPVCYCKECVFLTDVFAHDPALLIRRAQKKGMIKLPVETTMFHLTRLAHIGHACVACGHCSSVCPANIPVADFFITVGSRVQELLDYAPGRDVKEPIPYLVFEKKE
jgi:formate dehydrogenase subunit beta